MGVAIEPNPTAAPRPITNNARRAGGSRAKRPAWAADRHRLSTSGACGKPVPFGNNHDAAVGDREALSIAGPIKPEPLSRGNRHVLIDNATPQLRSLPDHDTLEQERILDHRALFDPHIRAEDGVSPGAADRQRAGR